jgi:tetratricopeptide (TPR) repeat protein
MVRRFSGRATRLFSIAVAALAIALPAVAQTTMVRGVVKDEKGQLVEGAKVSIEMVGGTGRKFEAKTDKKGEFIQIGLPSGRYNLTAEKDKLMSPPMSVNVSVRTPAVTELVLSAGGAASSAEGKAKSAELVKVFNEGIAAEGAGNHDAAIDAFTKASALSPNCYDCYYNIGVSEAAKKDYDKAEQAYKKALEMKSDYGEAYSGLSTIYNAQRKFDLAADAAAKATQYGGGGAAAAGAGGGGGNADALYNQGVILWNAGKIPDAKKQFEAAIQANPSHAESHYQLGMALVNEGNTAGAAKEFETYLNLAPTGPNAPTAKALMDQLKK